MGKLLENQWDIFCRHIADIMLAHGSDQKKNLNRILETTATYFACDAIALRLISENDFPYAACIGFTDEFIAAESSLRSPNAGYAGDNLLCLCGSVLDGTLRSKLGLETDFFYTNSIFDFIDSLRGQNVGIDLRNSCLAFGYASLAVFPVGSIESDGHYVGLIQVNHRTPDFFDEKKLSKFEELASILSIGLRYWEAQRLLGIARQNEALYKRVQSEFLAVLSHEVRTPLNAVVGFSGLLQQRLSDDPLGFEYARSVQVSSKLLLGLINDMLDVVKIESGFIKLHENSVDLAYVVHNAVSIVEEMVKKAEVELLCDTNGLRSRLYTGDNVRITQILVNLVTNAVKFTRKGKVYVKVSVNDDLSTDVYDIIMFEIKDSGAGISPQDMERIFKPFVMGDSTDTRASGGVGLGLTIVKSLVELMEGTVDVSSAPGYGSTFTVSIPLKHILQTNHDAACEMITNLKKKNVLLAASDDMVRKYLSGILSSWDGKVNAFAGLNDICSEIERFDYDIVVLDLLFNEHFIEGIKKIREIHTDIPIVVLMSRKSIHLMEQLFEAGADECLVRPFDPELFKNKIITLLGGT